MSTGDQNQGRGREAAEQIFAGFIQAIGENTALLSQLIEEVRGLREDIRGNADPNRDNLQKAITDLIDNTASLGEDMEMLTGAMGTGLTLLRGAAEVGRNGKLTWDDLAEIFTQMDLDAQVQEQEQEEEEEPA